MHAYLGERRRLVTARGAVVRALRCLAAATFPFGGGLGLSAGQPLAFAFDRTPPLLLGPSAQMPHLTPPLRRKDDHMIGRDAARFGYSCQAGFCAAGFASEERIKRRHPA